MLKNTDKPKCVKRLLYKKVIFDTKNPNIIVKNFHSHNNKFFSFSFVEMYQIKVMCMLNDNLKSLTCLTQCLCDSVDDLANKLYHTQTPGHFASRLLSFQSPYKNIKFLIRFDTI